MDFVKKNAKAIVTFIITAIAQGISSQIASEQPLPEDWAGWLALLGTSLVAAVVVWITGNKQSAEQVTASMRKLDPVEQEQVAKDTLDVLPNSVSDEVVNTYPRWNAS